MNRWEELPSAVLSLVIEFLEIEIPDKDMISFDYKNLVQNLALVCKNWSNLWTNYCAETLDFRFDPKTRRTQKESFKKLLEKVEKRGSKLKCMELYWTPTKEELNEEPNLQALSMWGSVRYQVFAWNQVFRHCSKLQVICLRAFDAPFLVVTQLINVISIECKSTLNTLILPHDAPWHRENCRTNYNDLSTPSLIAFTDVYEDVMCQFISTVHDGGSRVKRLSLYENCVNPTVLQKIFSLHGESLEQLKGFSFPLLYAFGHAGMNGFRVKNAWKELCEKATRLKEFEWYVIPHVPYYYYEFFASTPKPLLKKLVIDFEFNRSEDDSFGASGDSFPMRDAQGLIDREGLLHDFPTIQDFFYSLSRRAYVERREQEPPWALDTRTLLILKGCPGLEQLEWRSGGFELTSINDQFLSKLAEQCPLLKKITLVLGSNEFFTCVPPDPNTYQFQQITDDGLIQLIDGLPDLKELIIDEPVLQLTWKSFYHLLQVSSLRGACIRLQVCVKVETLQTEILPELMEKVMDLVAKADAKSLSSVDILFIRDFENFSSTFRQQKLSVWMHQIEKMVIKNPQHLLELKEDEMYGRSLSLRYRYQKSLVTVKQDQTKTLRKRHKAK